MNKDQAEVLVVNGNEQEAAGCYALLRKHFPDCRVYLTPNAFRALEFLQATGSYSHRRNNHLPTLAIIDENLSDRDGFWLVREISQNPELKSLPVIMTYGSAETISSENNFGQSDLVKPITLLKFGQALEDVGLENVFRKLNARIQTVSRGGSTRAGAL